MSALVVLSIACAAFIAGNGTGLGIAAFMRGLSDRPDASSEEREDEIACAIESDLLNHVIELNSKGIA